MTEKSNLYLTTLSLFLISIIGVGCRSNSPLQQTASSTDQIARTKLGEPFSRVDNEDKTYALVQQVRRQDHLKQTIKYLVIQLKDNSIVHEGSFKMGYVKWNSNETIEVFNGDTLNDSKSEKKIIHILSNQR